MNDTTTIFKVDNDQRLLYGIVMEPNVVDSQGDFAKPEQIEKAAHSFLEFYNEVGVGHQRAAPDVKVVESFIAPIDMEMGGQQIKKGTWIMVSKVHNDELWQEVKKGDLTGYSIQGTALTEGK